MDRSSFRNIYNVYFNLISFIIKIPKIVESRECPSVRSAVSAVSAHVPVFEHLETQYSHGYKSLRPGVPIFGDPVSAQWSCYLPNAKNFYKY